MFKMTVLIIVDSGLAYSFTHLLSSIIHIISHQRIVVSPVRIILPSFC
jgi:hypothetical protein